MTKIPYILDLGCKSCPYNSNIKKKKKKNLQGPLGQCLDLILKTSKHAMFCSMLWLKSQKDFKDVLEEDK